MEFNQIKPENLDYYRADKPIQSVYLEFVRKNCAEILDLGEFEALRRWLECIPVCMPVVVRPAESGLFGISAMRKWRDSTTRSGG